MRAEAGVVAAPDAANVVRRLEYGERDAAFLQRPRLLEACNASTHDCHVHAHRRGTLRTARGLASAMRDARRVAGRSGAAEWTALTTTRIAAPCRLQPLHGERTEPSCAGAVSDALDVSTAVTASAPQRGRSCGRAGLARGAAAASMCTAGVAHARMRCASRASARALESVTALRTASIFDERGQLATPKAGNRCASWQQAVKLSIMLWAPPPPSGPGRRTTPRRATRSTTVRMTREIVTIDLSDFENRKQEIASQLLHASKDVGFFYVSGHGCGGGSTAQRLRINRMRARQLLRRWAALQHAARRRRWC